MKRKKKTEKPLPGYPPYPESEDIMQNEPRSDADVENLSNSPDAGSIKLKKRSTDRKTKRKKNTPEIGGTEADVTKEDLLTLGRIDRDQDEGEDETLLPLLEIGPDFTGDDLDVPGSELDDDAEDIGSEDEENNYYSRGQE